MRWSGALLCALTVATLHPEAAGATDARDARVELVTTSTLYGVGVGVLAAHDFDLSARPAAWLAAGAGGGMLYGSYRLGEALRLDAADVRYVESTAGWLGLDAFLLTGTFAASSRHAAWAGLAAAGLGGGAALLTRGGVRASEGQLSMVNSGGLWMPIAGFLTALTFELEPDSFTHTFLALNLSGLTAGAALCAAYDPTREQVLYMDGGLLLGGLSGGLVGTMVGIVIEAGAPISGLALVGMGAGAALTMNAHGFDRRRASRGAPTTPKRAERAVMLPLMMGAF